MSKDKKSFNPLTAIGDFIADIAEGKIFDIDTPEVETKPAKEVTKNDNGNDGNDAPKPNKRNGSTFNDATTEKGKGTPIDSGNGKSGGNDGKSVSGNEGTETGKP